MLIYSIYKATNKINGKSYIGFDSNWPSRKYKHKSRSATGQQALYCSIRKYGWDNFEWIVIYQSKDAKHTLNEIEPFFIREYNSYKNGYNMTIGGDGSIGYKHSDEMKKYLSEQKTGIKNPMFKKVVSEETKRKLSNLNKGRKFSEESLSTWGKLYLITDPNGSQFKIKNLNKFCRENNLDSGHMVAIAKGDRKTHKKYKCEYYG